jgi:hypothetical protein
MSPELEAAKMAERDAFLESVRKTMGKENLPMEPAKPSDIPLLDPKKVDLTKLRPGKINQQPERWVSPRLEQQYPDLARRLRATERDKFLNQRKKTDEKK